MKPKMVGRDSVGRSVCNIRGNAGLLGSSLVMTLDGEKPVETLKAGDRVITRNQGMAMLEAVRSFRVSGYSVTIKASALGHNRPERDIVVPAGLPILIRDWRAQTLFGQPQVMLRASRLVDGTYMTLLPESEMTVFELVFDTPHVLYVDGMEVASYIGDLPADQKQRTPQARQQPKN